MTLYTTIDDIMGETQMGIDGNSKPSIRMVNRWITRISKHIDNQLLGTYSETKYIDVSSVADKTREPVTYNYKSDILNFGMGADGVYVPVTSMKQPVTSITTLSKNDASITSAPSWEELTKWTGAVASDWGEILSQNYVTGIYIFDDEPLAGFNRLKVVYSYGFNIDSDILNEYCTMAVAIKVLNARTLAGRPGNMRQIAGVDLVDFIDFVRDTIGYWKGRMRSIEDDHFPKPKKVRTGVAIIQ